MLKNFGPKKKQQQDAELPEEELQNDNNYLGLDDIDYDEESSPDRFDGDDDWLFDEYDDYEDDEF